MFKKLLLLLAVLIAGFAVVVALQPNTYKTSRSTVIAAAPEAIFPHVNNLKAWDAWSPWAKLDPNAKVTYEGPEEGVGAAMAWEGNSEVGVGRLEVTASTPGELLAYRLDFKKPMEGTSSSAFILAPAEGGTKVTWEMGGENTFIGKAMWLLFCRGMMDKQFDKGLASLKSVVEGK